ncbi:hypothetical protein TEA_026543 [Camellia sinensis var. sinensis]|uniref:Reticulon-like protein n=1 Tax=Camellia sinensis var. sinensis TaxID=542762 RepID=A0A4S4CZR5_CAMSN|nr:hypothetical protein TEA_026543 [Camellia sinensis var. sinensis]
MVDSRRISVHQSLGGGAVADVLLWRRWCGGVVLLVGSTSLWILFERAGYNLLSFAANVLLLLVAVLFFWGKSASLLNRPLPPLPDLEVSEESVLRAADEARVWINHALSVARDIAVEGNLKIFIQVALVLWIISYIGSFFNFLTLVYVGVLLSLSVPVLYEKYQDQIDEKLIVAHKIIQTQVVYVEIDSQHIKLGSTDTDTDTIRYGDTTKFEKLGYGFWFSSTNEMLRGELGFVEPGYAILGTGLLSDGGKVTDRNSSSEETSPKKWERIVFADACNKIDA